MEIPDKKRVRTCKKLIGWKGTFAHIDYEKMEVIVSGTVNDKWVTDSNRDLIRVD